MLGQLKTLFSYSYNRQNPFKALRRMWKWKQVKNQQQKQVFDFWEDTKIYCYPESTSSMWLIYSYYYDEKEFMFLSKYLRNTDLVFDIGANIGIYFLWMFKFVKQGKIIAFEPDTTNFERAKEQIELNAVRNIHLEQLALSNQNGYIRFSVGKDMENHVVLDDVTQDFIEVKSQKLDEYCKENHYSQIDFLKLDVEGAELFVLEGATQLLADKAVKVILFEVNHQKDKFDIEDNQLVSFLKQKGYYFFDYDLVQNQLIPLSSLPATHTNILAIADVDFVLNRLTN